MSDTKTLAGQDADPDPDPDSLPTLGPGRFILLTHGQTPWSLLGRLQGRGNHAFTHLTTLGKAQAEAMVPLLRGAGVRHVVSGGSHRAQQSMTIIGDALRQAVRRVDHALDDRCFGLLEGATLEEARFRGNQPNNVEDDAALVKRVVPGIGYWCNVFGGHTVAFVTHGEVVTAMGRHLGHARALPVGEGRAFSFASDDGNRWMIDQMGRES